MSQFLHNNDNAKAIAIPRVSSKKRRAKNVTAFSFSHNTVMSFLAQGHLSSGLYGKGKVLLTK